MIIVALLFCITAQLVAMENVDPATFERYKVLVQTGMEIGKELVDKGTISNENILYNGYKEMYETLSDSQKGFDKDLKIKAADIYQRISQEGSFKDSLKLAQHSKTDEKWAEFRKNVLHSLADQADATGLIKVRRKPDQTKEAWIEYYTMNKDNNGEEGKKVLMTTTLAMMQFSSAFLEYKKNNIQ